MPKTSPPSSGTESARTGSSVSRADSARRAQGETEFVQQIDAHAHGGDDQATDGADQHRKRE